LIIGIDLQVPFGEGGGLLLFHTFGSQEERRKFGGSCFTEIQYCRLPENTQLEKIISVKAITDWKNDSLYIYGDDMADFYAQYGPIITGGTYNNLEQGPVDLYGINFFTQKQAAQIIERIEAERPPEYQVLRDWLNAGKQFIGFYVLGV